MLASFLLIGMNHRTAGVDIRERYNLADKCAPDSWAMPCLNGVEEALILSTCNRVEILASGRENLEAQMLQNWAGACGSDPDELEPYIYKFEGLAAARHVFEVAASLDSMVLGEPQILGQLKAAYRKAVENRSAGPLINRLLHSAFYAAKRVRHETAIAANAVSVSYAAVELARSIFGALPSHRALLAGAGEMAELAAMHLMQAGIEEIIVSNRTLANARALADRVHGRVAPFEDLGKSLADADIIIASTGSPEPVINVDDVKKALKARKNRPMFFIDIAVPRDVDPAVNSLDNVYLYDIDDLRDVVEENLAARRVEAESAKRIIEEEVAKFGNWLEGLDVKPAILDMIRRGEAAAQIELSRTFRRLKNIDPETKSAIEKMAASLVKRLNHDPIMYLKEKGMGRDDAHSRIGAIRRIFRLDAKPGEDK